MKLHENQAKFTEMLPSHSVCPLDSHSDSDGHWMIVNDSKAGYPQKAQLDFSVCYDVML